MNLRSNVVGFALTLLVSGPWLWRSEAQSPQPIRPLLWKQLKVGARVVSHRFTMGDWTPDETVYLDQGDAGEYPVHLWTITHEVKNGAADL